ncbi:UbiA prenyltransferase [Mycena chlorophos]|uniref:UbiA prenyltransferase n=1 Tax=Mycena chlorophos TaxID=658473 RepID=A0A8H6TK37_MYCCL|nr:UbiA prenyltransferase [Mycena chlorophos]
MVQTSQVDNHRVRSTLLMRSCQLTVFLYPETPNIELQAEESGGILGVSFLYDALVSEVHLFWRFSWRDFTMTVIPGSTYTLAALRSLSPTELPAPSLLIPPLTRSVVYFIFFIYSFNLANQLNGLAEDRINKPDRPLASGLVSVKGAYIRWYLTTFALLTTGYAWGIPKWALTWVGITIYTSWCGGDKHWATKNLFFMSTGAVAILAPGWELGIGTIPPLVWRSMIQLGTILSVVAHLQDMRDVAGDTAAGRKTLPIALGSDFPWIMASIVALCPFVGWKLQVLHSEVGNEMVWYSGALLSLATFYVAYRVLVGKEKNYHHKTYMYLTYIYCGCVAVPVLFP